MIINNDITGCAIVTATSSNRRITVSNAEDFKKELLKVLDNNYLYLILNMKDIDIIDSTGLGIIITSYNRAQNRNCKFILCNLSNAVANLLHMTKLDQALDIYSSVDEAVASIK